MSILRKRDSEQSAGGGAGKTDVCSLAARYPGLWEMLTATVYPGGGVRVTSTLSLFLDAYGLKAALKDRDNVLVAFVTAETLTGLLEALESGIQGDSLDWRQDANGTYKKKR